MVQMIKWWTRTLKQLIQIYSRKYRKGLSMRREMGSFFLNELIDMRSIHLRFFKNILADRINTSLTTVKERISEAEDKNETS